MPALRARQVELRWSERGEGDSVVLVHETGTGAGVWAPLAELLSASARVVSYDRRGWGDSSATEDYRRTTVEEQSEDLAALIEATGAGPAVLCGAGLGAVAALDLSLRRAELVRGAVLIEPPLLPLVLGATEALSNDRGALERASAEGMGAVLDLYLSGSLGALGPGAERLPAELAAASRARPRTLIAELGAVTGWAVAPRALVSAKRPSRVLVCPGTPPIVREACTALVGRLAESELRELPATPGPPHLSDPDEVAAIALRLAR